MHNANYVHSSHCLSTPVNKLVTLQKSPLILAISPQLDVVQSWGWAQGQEKEMNMVM